MPQNHHIRHQNQQVEEEEQSNHDHGQTSRKSSSDLHIWAVANLRTSNNSFSHAHRFLHGVNNGDGYHASDSHRPHDDANSVGKGRSLEAGEETARKKGDAPIGSGGVGVLEEEKKDKCSMLYNNEMH